MLTGWRRLPSQCEAELDGANSRLKELEAKLAEAKPADAPADQADGQTDQHPADKVPGPSLPINEGDPERPSGETELEGLEGLEKAGGEGGEGGGDLARRLREAEAMVARLKAEMAEAEAMVARFEAEQEGTVKQVGGCFRSFLMASDCSPSDCSPAFGAFPLRASSAFYPPSLSLGASPPHPPLVLPSPPAVEQVLQSLTSMRSYLVRSLTGGTQPSLLINGADPVSGLVGGDWAACSAPLKISNVHDAIRQVRDCFELLLIAPRCVQLLPIASDCFRLLPTCTQRHPAGPLTSAERSRGHLAQAGRARQGRGAIAGRRRAHILFAALESPVASCHPAGLDDRVRATAPSECHPRALSLPGLTPRLTRPSPRAGTRKAAPRAAASRSKAGPTRTIPTGPHAMSPLATTTRTRPRHPPACRTRRRTRRRATGRRRATRR